MILVRATVLIPVFSYLFFPKGSCFQCQRLCRTYQQEKEMRDAVFQRYTKIQQYVTIRCLNCFLPPLPPRFPLNPAGQQSSDPNHQCHDRACRQVRPRDGHILCLVTRKRLWLWGAVDVSVMLPSPLQPPRHCFSSWYETSLLNFIPPGQHQEISLSQFWSTSHMWRFGSL